MCNAFLSHFWSRWLTFCLAGDGFAWYVWLRWGMGTPPPQAGVVLVSNAGDPALALGKRRQRPPAAAQLPVWFIHCTRPGLRCPWGGQALPMRWPGPPRGCKAGRFQAQVTGPGRVPQPCPSPGPQTGAPAAGGPHKPPRPLPLSRRYQLRFCLIHFLRIII